MKKLLVYLTLFTVLFVVGYVFVVGFGSKKDLGDESLYDLLRLPDSPYNATYNIYGEEVAFSEGVSVSEEGNGATYNIYSDPVFGDVNSDGVDDAVVLLEGRDGDAVSYYVAAALFDTDGYIGLEAIPLGLGTITELLVKDDVVSVVYDSGDEENFVLVYVTLQKFEPVRESDAIYTGNLSYSGETLMFTPCESEVSYPVLKSSNSYVALGVVYSERTRVNRGVSVYAVLSGSIEAEEKVVESTEEDAEIEESEDTESTAETGGLFVSSILTVPFEGKCEVLEGVEVKEGLNEEVSPEGEETGSLDPEEVVETEEEL